jgi:hypothetical protein
MLSWWEVKFMNKTLDTNGFECVMDAMEIHHNRLAGKVYNLLEAVISDSIRCGAAKNLIREIVGRERERLHDYCIDVMFQDARGVYLTQRDALIEEN